MTYDICVRHTFLQFSAAESIDDPREAEIRASSCPPRIRHPEIRSKDLQKECDLEEQSTTADSESISLSLQSTPVNLGTSGLSLQPTPLTGSLDSPNRPQKGKPMDSQKRINRALLDSSRSENGFQVLGVVSENLHNMNGVNLATAFHRIARSQISQQLVQTRVFQAMLHAAEQMAEGPDGAEGSLPANCCTIIAWSLASLGVFQAPLFRLLSRAAVPHLERCQPYEVTNLLWAFAQLQKLRPDLGVVLATELQELAGAVAQRFQVLTDVKAQVLVSALVSLANFSNPQAWLVLDISERLARAELTPENRRQIGIAFSFLRSKNPQLAAACAGASACFGPKAKAQLTS